MSSVVAMTLAGTVQAAEWNANVSAASDYIVRGMTRSLNSAVIQGSIALQGERSWATGVWASSVELYEGAGQHAEVDYFLTGELPLSRDWRLGGQATRYEFTGESRYFSYDYTDVALSLSFQDTLTASVAWSPDYSYFGRYGPVPDATMVSYELFARYPLGRYVQMTAGVGRTELGSRDDAYNFWSGGGEIAWERLSLSFSYVSTNGAARHLFGDLAAQNAWVATLSFRLR
jgi:uncharacterized protein (TIGR02001 family)